jgi:hypothetical protein
VCVCRFIICACVRVHAILRDEKIMCIHTYSWFILDLNVVSLQVEDSSMIIGVGLNIKEKRDIGASLSVTM